MVYIQTGPPTEWGIQLGSIRTKDASSIDAIIRKDPRRLIRVYSVWIKTWISRKHVIMKIDQTPSVWNGPVQRVAVEESTRHTWVKGWDNFLWWSTCGLELSPTGTSLLYNVALASMQRHNFLQRCISVDGEALRYIDVETTLFNVACPLRLYCDLKRSFLFRSAAGWLVLS